MKKLFTLITLLPFLTASALTSNGDKVIENPYASSFEKAYQQFPLIKHGVLEAVSYTNTRFSHLKDEGFESCIGMPRAYGVMGLVKDGKGFFYNNLIVCANISGISEKDIIENPEKNILAYAALLDHVLKIQQIGSADGIEKQLSAAVVISELPLDFENKAISYARESFIYSLALFISNKDFQVLYHFPDYKLNLPVLFGDDYAVLSSGSVVINQDQVASKEGNQFKATLITTGTLSADYPPALWNPIPSCNYSVGRPSAISAVTIHDVEGSYAGCISWFQNCAASVSAHYVVRSSDGQITQMVSESDKAWHVGSENGYTVGIEHEGYQSQTGWYTSAMYSASAGIVRHLSTAYGIPTINTAWWPWSATTNYNPSAIPGSCTKIKGHQHFPNQTHTDPGPNWDWDRFFKLINTAPATIVYSTSTGTSYDSGGPSANYSDNERTIWTISPTNATQVRLNFTMFNTENTWDYLYIYNGNSINAPLIGRYTGTTSPGIINSTGGSLTLEFRSDCATTAPGWAATWTSTFATGLQTNEQFVELNVYPNPFGSSTTISYTLAENSPMKIILVDVLGREIEILNIANNTAGKHDLILDADALSLSKGIYFLELISGSKVHTKKLVVN